MEPAINNYLLKSQMTESSNCQFSCLLEGFNKLSSCKKKKKNTVGDKHFVRERSQAANALSTEWKYYVLPFLEY